MYKQLSEKLKTLGARNVGAVEVDRIEFEKSFRTLCESNACGMFGNCWMCPPFCGDIDSLIDEAKKYDKAVIYQTIDELEDSYDIEGMLEAGEKMSKLTAKARSYLTNEMNELKYLFLGAGACRMCERCAKRDDEPCRCPDLAIASLEAYGINVSTLASLAGMKYVNGANTVTFFGAILIGE